jgi:ferredoxin
MRRHLKLCLDCRACETACPSGVEYGRLIEPVARRYLAQARAGENPFNTILSSKFFEVQKYLSVTNHVYSPWLVLVSKKWWDQLSKDEQKVLMDAARASREFERKDTREEAGRALTDLKAKGMQINELSPAEAARMRDKLTQVNAGIAVNVGMDLWNETQAALAKMRGKQATSGAAARGYAAQGRAAVRSAWPPAAVNRTPPGSALGPRRHAAWFLPCGHEIGQLPVCVGQMRHEPLLEQRHGRARGQKAGTGTRQVAQARQPTAEFLMLLAVALEVRVADLAHQRLFAGKVCPRLGRQARAGHHDVAPVPGADGDQEVVEPLQKRVMLAGQGLAFGQ